MRVCLDCGASISDPDEPHFAATSHSLYFFPTGLLVCFRCGYQFKIEELDPKTKALAETATEATMERLKKFIISRHEET